MKQHIFSSLLGIFLSQRAEIPWKTGDTLFEKLYCHLLSFYCIQLCIYNSVTQKSTGFLDWNRQCTVNVSVVFAIEALQAVNQGGRRKLSYCRACFWSHVGVPSLFV